MKVDRTLISGLSNTLDKLVNKLQDTQTRMYILAYWYTRARTYKWGHVYTLATMYTQMRVYKLAFHNTVVRLHRESRVYKLALLYMFARIFKGLI